MKLQTDKLPHCELILVPRETNA